uniref:Hemocytin n=1 Tax=Cacopsylla melanoneura TaxID=428564 RepID=A0A8D8ZF36_9HEMI
MNGFILLTCLTAVTSATYFDSADVEDFYDTGEESDSSSIISGGGEHGTAEDMLAKMMYGDPEPEPEPEPHHHGGHYSSKKKKVHIQHSYSGGFHESHHEHTKSDECLPFQAPMNSQVKCKKNKCIVSCMKDYQFPDASRTMMVSCLDGKWVIKDTLSDAIPHCEPICPSCQNGGYCSAPYTCTCKPNYFGPNCEFEKLPCSGFPSTPDNAHKVCTSEFCTVSCMEGYKFPDGSGVANIMCKNGHWTPARPDWHQVPSCQATCEPTCLNGGSCISLNTCQCPQSYRGPQCQYPIEVCDVKKLNFNGNYKCSGNSNSFSCVLNCPSGMQFESEPASLYVCQYDQGRFMPDNIPRCVFDGELSHSHSIIKESIHTEYSSNSLSHSHSYPGGYKVKDIIDALFLVEIRSPAPSTCFIWNKRHVRTFDGVLYSFNKGLSCAYTLLKTDSLSIVADFDSPDSCAGVACVKQLTIYVGETKYKLGLDDLGQGVLSLKGKVISIPSQLDVLKVESSPDNNILVTLSSTGVTLLWNAQDLIKIHVTEAAWNKTSGLCGHIDGDATNDLAEVNNNVLGYLDKYKVSNLVNTCSEDSNHGGAGYEENTEEMKTRGHEFCKVLLEDSRFSQCRSVLPTHNYYQACLSDYSLCSGPHCGCSSLQYFAQDCLLRNSSWKISWRDENLCPITCSPDKVYSTCVPHIQASCSSETLTLDSDSDQCSEGCTCPSGTVLHNNTCIPKTQCPCTLRGKEYSPGEKIWKNCNTCSCQSGQWSCTTRQCPGVCSAIGDPHYKTFDGHKFNFMGKCSYTLVKAKNYSIEQENVACSGAISQAMGLSSMPGTPSCTRSVTINVGDIYEIKLKSNKVVLVNKEEVNTKLPLLIPHVAYIRYASSLFVQVELFDSVEVWWDGETRVYVKAPPQLFGQTKGLCGTFNDNQKDEFLTPEGDVEPDVNSFATKWQTNELCDNIRVERETEHPCDANVERKLMAQHMCKNITSNLFADCHLVVDPTPFYEDCLYDLCSCQGTPLAQCFCPILAAYAKECSHHGTPLEWRSSIRECGVQCPSGQEFQSCGNSCHRTCSDISHRLSCEVECVEGCNCGEGFTLNKYGECIPIGSCPCVSHGLEYPPHHKEIRPGVKGLQLCECKNAVWDCKLATEQEVATYPNESFERSTHCNASQHLVFTHCEPAEPITCHNMGKSPSVQHSPALCRAGCVCKQGYVLDSISKQCVLPTQCPCHHGGQSYQDGTVINEQCNTCTCQQGHWNCTKEECSGVCTAWGDSHFETFDARNFDFQGACEYVLVKGCANDDDEEAFVVVIEVVPCGSTGVSCSKSVKVSTGSKKNGESITLTRNKPLPEPGLYHKLSLREAGLFVFVELQEIGVTVQWDKGTRVSVTVSPKWKSKVKGLCGNYNDNEEDDFQSPSGGISEVSPMLFGDSWRVHPYCPPAVQVQDTCSKHPNRKLWALQQCNLLKSELFQPCHSEVPVDSYFERCVFDSCACDEGGDCECLCTALASYAEQCNAQGVHIRWRSQQLCPMQCDESCSHYEACISPCPVETCHNSLDYAKTLHLCQHQTCIEGCKLKPCPEGQIYNSTSNMTCVPKASCKHFCMRQGDKVFYEGDLMEEDECHSCYCSRNQKTCSGSPCTTQGPVVTTTTPTPTPTHPPTVDMNEQSLACRQGWSIWVNKDVSPSHKMKSRDEEPVPSFKELVSGDSGNSSEHGVCTASQASDIRCRTVHSHLGVKETGQNVECSLERGLICEGECDDYEVSVYCSCEQTTLPSVTTVKHEEKKTFVTEPVLIDTAEGCQGGVWKECLVECNQVCHSYQQKLFAEGECTSASHQCISGCWAWGDTNTKCPLGSMWREWGFCVKQSDCTCLSRNGTLVKPGGIVYENECELCQCLNNHYTCDTTICHSTTQPPPTTEQEPPRTTVEDTPTTQHNIIIIRSTVTPPASCALNITSLLDGLPSSAFTASSFIDGVSSLAKPENGRLSSTSSGTWKASTLDQHQYLDINLGQLEPVYGVRTRGSPEAYEFVTSFKVMFSSDGVSYSYVMDEEGETKIFRGPINNHDTVTSLFPQPIEAWHVRMNPLTWTNEIALNVDILGCKATPSPISTEETTRKPPTTIPTVGTTRGPVCKDEMGLQAGLMAAQQISTSSSQVGFKPQDLALTSSSAWSPFISSPHQWVQLDFLGDRILTGMSIRGGDVPNSIGKEEEWVEGFHVLYSKDEVEWNKIFDEDMSEKIFPGNFDASTVHTVLFDVPIKARYIRINPVKWHNGISLRLEVLGCFEAYPTTPPPTVPTPPPPAKIKDCPECPGLKSDISICVCQPNEFYDGENCVNKTQCPCYVGHMAYSVGTTYNTESCEQCTCSIGGIPTCHKKHCEKCPEGLRSKMSSSCECSCEPCPSGTKLCPTSNFCLNTTQWCDGVRDCPDDELNCADSSHKILVPTPPHIAQIRSCPAVSCPKGFVANMSSRSHEVEWSPFGGQSQSSFFKTEHKTVKHFVHKSGNSKSSMVVKRTHHIITEQIIQDIEGGSSGNDAECPEYQCVPVIDNKLTCALKPKCPEGYELFVERSEDGNCPVYFCRPCRLPDATCNVTSRTFHTFDNTEFKYDICSHVLAASKHGTWKITLKKSCAYIGQCSKSLTVHQFNQTIELFSNLTILYNGFQYNVAQVQKICDQEETFRIKQISDSYLVFASVLEFSIIWDSQGNVRLTVPATMSGSVVGLCGYFDGNRDNDKLTPDGQLALSSTEFGDSWRDNTTSSGECEIKVCPIEIQNKAWEFCKVLQKSPLDRCGSLLSVDRAISDCVESMCVCLESSVSNENECRCNTLSNYVATCKALDSSVDLSGWRLTHNCAVECPHPLVYNECFDRVCEPGCNDLMSSSDPCPIMPGHCFPGCYCPDGYVREGSQCVKPADCRDCVCDGFGKSHFLTFDKVDYSFSSNCSYILSETNDKFKQDSGVRVIVTNEPCHELSEETCVKSITILYKGKSVAVTTKSYNDLAVSFDQNEVIKFPHATDLFNASWIPGSGVEISLPEIHLNLIYSTQKRGFSLRVPSNLYYDATQGLCGSCNLNQTDDLALPNTTVAESIDQFVTEWKYIDINNTLGFNDVCSVATHEKECIPPASHVDPCLMLLDNVRFGRCHPVIDPTEYVARCHQSLCESQQVSVCSELEAYARECQHAGICLEWRSQDLCPYQCPLGLQYRACSLGCTETCDTYQMLREGNMCFNPMQEACVCPPGKVFQGDSCIEETRCSPCDSEGHYMGDEWHPTNCTTCRCLTISSVACEVTSCPLADTICAMGFRSVVVKGTEDQCCPSHICVPEPTSGPVCPDPQKPHCGPGQVLKLETLYNGCQEFICQCKPPSECDPVDVSMQDAELLPGMVKVINHSGCCPSLNIECRPESCPAPQVCPQHMVLTTTPGASCCPSYECNPPPFTCIHEFEYTSSELGGEQQLTLNERYTALKHVGEVWQDGPCRRCECLPGDTKAHCAVTYCPHQPISNDYVLVHTYSPNTCCPQYKAQACKHHGTEYSVGSTWHATPGDYCKNLTCVRDQNGEVTKVETVQSCNTECASGWRYERNPHACCGHCVAYACAVDNMVYEQGAVWHSDDKCTQFSCDKFGDQFQIVASSETCPDVSHCPENKLYQDGCCEKCNLTIENLSSCYPELVEADSSIRAVSVLVFSHGECTNKAPIPNLTQCRGPCSVSSSYNTYSNTYETSCQCCKATDYTMIDVTLTCEDSFEIIQSVQVPSKCSCNVCGGEIELRSSPGRAEKIISY